MARIMLLDGNSLAYRAFFALPTDLATASGQVTNAVYGFTSMLINLLKDHQPAGIAVAWDRPEPTFRHAMVPDYKAGRAEAPDILRQQLGLVRQVEPELRRRHPLVRRAVVPGIGECTIPDLEEDFEELLDALLIHCRPTLVGEVVGGHRVGHELGVPG